MSIHNPDSHFAFKIISYISEIFEFERHVNVNLIQIKSCYGKTLLRTTLTQRLCWPFAMVVYLTERVMCDLWILVFLCGITL